MSYTHKLVSALSAPIGNDLHNNPNYTDWPHKLDGIPVHREVYNFGTELRRSYHGFRFHASSKDNHTSHREFGTIRAYSDVTVYIEGADYAVGVIGFGRTYGVKEVTVGVHMVQSRKIANAKFKDNREQYHMMFASDPKKALRTALSKLVPYSPKEMADISLHDFKSHVNKVRNDIHSEIGGLIGPLMDYNTMMTEMRSLIAQNTMFVTERFQRAAAGFIAAEAASSAVRNKPIHGYYVYVRMVGDEQWVDIVEATDAQRYHNVNGCPVTSVPVSDVPEDIQGKVAVLSMAAIGQYMQGVGVRTTEKSFWLER